MSYSMDITAMNAMKVRNRYRIGLLGMLLLGTTAWAQQDTPPPAAQGPATPAPAFGQDQPAPQVTQAPRSDLAGSGVPRAHRSLLAVFYSQAFTRRSL